jgi:tetratricopeptide (TPR) repeat protein
VTTSGRDSRGIGLPLLCAWLVLFSAPPAARSQTPQPQAISLLGRSLAPIALEPEAEARMQSQLAAAVASWEQDRDDADALIWVGRRTGYLGRYREAIEIFTEGLSRHPADARMYRHRGHRYLTVREIDRAIADFEKAADLMTGQPDAIEPDGLPNARNIPTGTLHSNVWYHLALAYYLKGDFSRAADIGFKARDSVGNADNLVAASHWLYLSLHRAGRHAEAAAVLWPVKAELDVIENTEYHQLLLMYRGERKAEDLIAAAGEDSGGSATRYGVSAWLLVNGRRDEAESLWKSILEGSDWPSFGHLAAEAEMARGTGQASVRPESERSAEAVDLPPR